MLMTQTMRWFGPVDPVRLRDIRQCGASGVVTALHEVPNGEPWPRAAIAARRAEVEAAGLDWRIVESLPVHDAIKAGHGERDRLIAAYVDSLRNLAAEGIEVVTYNFMPLLDWTRTDLAWELADGARALRFEWEALALFDIHILRRAGAEADYDEDVRLAAARRHAEMSEDARDGLARTVLAGLPGSEESFGIAAFRNALDRYRNIDAETLHRNHVAFLEAVCPVAETLGLRLVVHPDDPPFSIFGLPRGVSDTADLDRLFAAVSSPAAGLCFCTGSFGARADNDLPAMVHRFADRIGFLHLRSVAREPAFRTFHEAAHLEGDAGMAAVMHAIVEISSKADRSIPMRPDHGHQILDDLGRRTNPGYSLLGRMRGLAELRGLERGIVAADRAEAARGLAGAS